MKKVLKYFLISIVTIIGIIFINGCYYVFRGQEKSMKKLQQGKELNLYECCSIYSMHTAIWMFGWPISVDAAKYAYWMQFDRCETRRDFTSVFYKSDVITSNPNWKTKTPFKVSWSIDLSKLSRKELYFALAYNSNNTWVYFTEDGYPLIEYRVEYQNVKYQFGIIPIYTGLFKYLQKIGWLYPYDLIIFSTDVIS